VPETVLDQSQLPEVASVQAVKNLALSARQRCPQVLAAVEAGSDRPPAELFQQLSAQPEGQAIVAELEQILERYGYLSEVGTDIAVPTWREDPQPVRDLFAQFFSQPPPSPTGSQEPASPHGGPLAQWRLSVVQRRLHLKGQVAQVYLTLLAELRWGLVALEQRAIAQGVLQQPGDIFFLTYAELQQWLASPTTAPAEEVQALVAQRRSQYQAHLDQTQVPFIVYGNEPPPTPTAGIAAASPAGQSGLWQGIGASPGQVQGPVKVLRSLQAASTMPPRAIIVVPYTDAGWAPILARAAGLVAEVGGRLSHGAIVAREYHIPAVMNIPHATDLFQDGQTLRIDGRTGTVELIEDEKGASA
jgi:pyruvate,water dikinase